MQCIPLVNSVVHRPQAKGDLETFYLASFPGSPGNANMYRHACTTSMFAFPSVVA